MFWNWLKTSDAICYRALTRQPVTVAIAVSLLVLFLVMTAYLSHYYGPWLDEFYSVAVAAPRLPLLVALKDSMSTDPQPPGYFLLLHEWVNIFGDSAFAMRTSNLIGIVILAFVMGYSWKLKWPRAVWLVFWALILSCRFAWDFATEARAYFLMYCTSTLMGILVFEIAGHLARGHVIAKEQVVLLALACAFASSMHYFGFLCSGTVLAALFVFALVRKDFVFAGVCAATGAVLLVAEGAWLTYSYPRIWFSAANFWMKFEPVLETMRFAVLTFSNNIFLLCLFAVAAVLARKTATRDQRLVLLAGACVLGYLAALVVSAKHPLLNHRYLSVFSPVILLIVTMTLYRGLGRKMLVPALACIVAISLPMAMVKAHPQRHDWRGASAYMEKHYARDCARAHIMMIDFQGADKVLQYFARGREWTAAGFSPEERDAALAGSCPVIGWVAHIDRGEVNRRLKQLGLSPATTRVLEFDGVYLVVDRTDLAQR